MAKISFFSQAKSYWNRLSKQQVDNTDDVVFIERDPSEDKNIIFFDIEYSTTSETITDIGAITVDDNKSHTSSSHAFLQFIEEADYICGHNIIHHDLCKLFGSPEKSNKKYIDTLFLSPLFFPKRPYHNLVKDDKIISDDVNNPVNDSYKAKELFYSEIEAFNALDASLKLLLFQLLYHKKEFQYFFDFVDYAPAPTDTEQLIRQYFSGKICEHAELKTLIDNNAIELAYALALINANDYHSIMPRWVVRNYPEIENVIKILRNTRCSSGCSYCDKAWDSVYNLKNFFGYDDFRTFEGIPLQRDAVDAAIKGESLLTIFPTGGGKSLTFQLPALMAGHNVSGLTVVISPLQSLMKDQVDNLAQQGITDAVSINGLLDPISRANAIERVDNGMASLLYIAPEMLRSKTIEHLLLKRNIVRFVIDEAHCFSSWGHDFRVDYLYIGDFIKNIQEKKHLKSPIPVSCFTATAKQKVIADIQDYFHKKLGLHLKLIASTSARKNLKYRVIHSETEDDKYSKLRDIIAANGCPTIVYVSRTRRSRELSSKLERDGITALPFNGRMESQDKIENQNAFINNEVQCMVATSAFGMGVDKKDVGLVIHYDISDSLENYVQEAGRAGRDPNTNAQCYVLYNDNDLDKHFILLNQSKISISEIQQIWRAIKTMTGQRKHFCSSALEIARQAGWDDTVNEIETRVKSAIAALENAGYIKRGHNVPHIYASGILAKNYEEARQRIDGSTLFDDDEKVIASRVIKKLISCKSRIHSQLDEAESRIDYIADSLGIKRADIQRVVELMRQERILADSKDMSAFISNNDSITKALNTLETHKSLEKCILERINEGYFDNLSYKEINQKALDKGIKSNINRIRTLLYFNTIKGVIKKVRPYEEENIINISLSHDLDNIIDQLEQRISICQHIINKLFNLPKTKSLEEKSHLLVQFSVLELLEEYNKNNNNLFYNTKTATIEDIENALLYLSTIGAIKLEGGFLITYNAMEIEKLVENKYQYKIDDYRQLDEFYKQKIQQIHIVGEYASLMTRDYNAALQFVSDYFQIDYKQFINKYFKGERKVEIERNITTQQYNKYFGELSDKQREIIEDKDSKYIVVAAGPGSGKTRILVHKLASLLTMEDVKHEQLLMLTFSRAAASEFKQRLHSLIGNAAHFVEIKTFHSYCFDLIGKIGNLTESKDVVKQATEMINNNEVEIGRIYKAVLVIDEAQDMDADEYKLINALMKVNEEMRVIAVGDDDQNIYGFRGADSKYMQSFIEQHKAKKYELTENYRSSQSVVSLANAYAQTITKRIKTQSIAAISNDFGSVNITIHSGNNMETPLVNDLLKYRNTNSICVLTRKNDEALLIRDLLKKKGANARLIQSLDSFRFYDLAEVRYFLKTIDKLSKGSLQVDIIWEEAKKKTFEYYASSTILPLLKTALEVFENTHNKKHKTDLMEFIYESNLEDFYEAGNETITISTIHKSKGKEFDDVHILLDSSFKYANDEQRRALYVGITRAKKRLFIHCNSDIIPSIKAKNIFYHKDITSYEEPSELTIQATLKDVFLDFFKDKKKHILNLKSGDRLTIKNMCFYSLDGTLVGEFSKKMKDNLQQYLDKGFAIYDAEVLYILAWRGKDEPKDAEETAVLLPTIHLRRNNGKDAS